MKQFWTLLLLTPWCLHGQSVLTKVVDPANPATTFTNTQSNYKGLAWIDLDDDNLPDLFVSQQFLFHNDGFGKFSQLPNLAGVTIEAGPAGSSWGDLNNDGHPDCITTGETSGLHYNNGDNTFSLQNSKLSNFTNYSAWDCALADADNNGLLDLLFVHAKGFHSSGPFPCHLYLQNTDGTFGAVTGYEFTDNLEPYTIPTWVDYDLDGDMDLFIGSGPGGMPGPDFCYKNLLKETGAFSLQRLSSAPFNAQQDGQTYNFIDLDNDGDLDFCLTNYAGATSRLYRRNDNGSYSGITTPFTTKTQNLANVWGDMDNDGFLDVLISSDAVKQVRYYRNKGDGTFESAKTAGAVSTNAAGVALADYDNDGDLDMYTNGTTEGRALFRNDTLAGNRHWVQFTLRGTQSNRSAIGAVIRIKATLNGVSMWQIRQVLAHNSFQSQSDLRQHFGLADASLIDSVEVRWPSGLKQVFTTVGSNGFYKITEGQDITLVTATDEPVKGIGLQCTPNPATGFFKITGSESDPELKNIQVFNVTGQPVPVSVERSYPGYIVRFNGITTPGVYLVRASGATHQMLIQRLIVGR